MKQSQFHSTNTNFDFRLNTLNLTRTTLLKDKMHAQSQ